MGLENTVGRTIVKAIVHEGEPLGDRAAAVVVRKGAASEVVGVVPKVTKPKEQVVDGASDFLADGSGAVTAPKAPPLSELPPPSGPPTGITVGGPKPKVRGVDPIGDTGALLTAASRLSTPPPQYQTIAPAFHEGRFADVIEEYRAARGADVVPDKISQEQYIVALNKTKQYTETLQEVQRYVTENTPVGAQRFNIRELDPLNPTIRNRPDLNGEVLAGAGKAFRELSAHAEAGTLSDAERALLRDFAGAPAAGAKPLTPGELSRQALELSTRYYEAGFFVDRSYYAAINAAHNNLRLGNVARSERFAWMAQSSMQDGGHGAADYWHRATQLEAGILTNNGRGVVDNFVTAARLADQPWMAGTTAQTLEDTYRALRLRTGIGRDETRLADTVTSAFRELERNPALRADESWLRQQAQRIREITGESAPGGAVAPASSIPAQYQAISRRISDQTIHAEWRHTVVDIDDLYRQAVPANDELRSMTTRLAQDTRGEPIFPPGTADNPGGLKGRERAAERIKDFAGDGSQLVDIVRSSVAYDNLADLYRGLDLISRTADIVGIKDRIMSPMGSGYRDILLKVRTSNGHVAEMQLHLRPILDVKNGPGHALYEAQRAVWAAAERENRALTSAELARIADYDRQMQELYGDAWVRSQ